jgi:hypothetical protein
MALLCAALLVALSAPAAAKGSKGKKGGDKGKDKKPAGAPACGIDFLPLVEGTVLTYKSYVPDSAPKNGLSVPPPDTLTVKVVKVETSGDGAAVTLEESYRKVVATTKLACDKNHLMVPPDSFFFAGEAGGGIGVTLDGLQATGDTYLVKGGLKENTYEELKAVAKRTPTSGSGAQLPDAKLELERKMTVKGPEAVDVGTGPQKATRVEVDLTGRAQLAVKDEKELNMPAQHATLWFVPGTGLVKAEVTDRLGWTLSDVK